MNLEQLKTEIAKLQEMIKQTEEMNKFTTAPMEFNKMDVMDCIKTFGHIHEVKTRIDEISKDVNIFYDFIRISVLPELVENSELESPINVTGVGRIVLTADLSVSMTDKEGAYNWLLEHGHGDLITETVNSSSLKALIKSKIKEGEDIDPDLFKVSTFSRASITKN